MAVQDELSKIFAAIEKLTLDEKRALVSFDKRISFLYDHKRYSRKLIHMLNKAKKLIIKGAGIDNKLLSEISEISLQIEGGLKEAFYALDPDTFSINEDVDALLQREMNTEMDAYRSSEEEPDSRAREKMLKGIRKILAYEKKEKEIVSGFNETLKRFKSLINDQKKYIQEELALLDEIRSAKQFTPIGIDAWMYSLNGYREGIEIFLKKEKDIMHEAADIMLRKGKRIYRLVKRIRKKGKAGEEDIKRDIQTFSSPAEFQRYQSALMRHPELLTDKARSLLSRGGLFSAAAAEKMEMGMKEMGEMAKFDRLTGLITRTFFESRVRPMLEHLRRENTPYSILFIDIDNFKRFNDNYGHGVGDAVLKETAEIIKSAVRRKRDFVVRWGGEEILVMLPGIEKKTAAAMAEKIRQDMEERSKILMGRINAEMPDIAKKRDGITVSIGAASSLLDSSDIEELIKIADKRLYTAKERGRNRVVYSG